MKIKDLFDKPQIEIEAEKEDRWVCYFEDYEHLTRYLKKWEGDEIWKRLLRTSFKENEEDVYRFNIFGKKFVFSRREKEQA